MTLAALAPADIVEELSRRKRKRGQIGEYFPAEGPTRRSLYPQHMSMFAAGQSAMSRLFMAANGVGKTVAGAYEFALHLTGLYPDWWQGYRYRRAPRFWIAGKTRQTTRDNQQRLLLGRPGSEAEGGGMVPVDCIDLDSIRRWPGGGGLIESVRVRHVSGQWSEVGVRSYDQSLDAWFGETLDGGWMDEPAPILHYSELVARTRGSEHPMLLVTFTPKHGMDELIQMFMGAEDESRKVITCSWDDVPHLSPEWKKAALENTPPYMRDTVSKGVPALGVGAVYPIPEDTFVIDPIEIRPHWPRAIGFDCGWHNTAAVWGAWDRDNDIWYLHREHKAGQMMIPIHAAAIKAAGDWIPVIGDAYATNQTDGKRMIDEYRDVGVKIFGAEKSGKEARIEKVRVGLATGKIKVFSNLKKWLEEYRMYHYDDHGKIVKVNDHLMDATQHLIDEGQRFGKTKAQATHIPPVIKGKQFGRRI